MPRRKPHQLSPFMSQAEFAKRIQDLFEKAQRMQDRLTAGYRYREVWIEGTDVRQHRRKGHWHMVAYKPQRAKGSHFPMPKKKKSK